MAGVSTGVSKFDSVVRGQHVFKSVWTLLTNKTHKLIMLEDNKRGKYAANDRLYQCPKGRYTYQERYQE